MIKIRTSAQRGHFDFGWLSTYHTFSFGEYHDPQFLSHGIMRVLNDDTVQPSAGFPQHGHNDMEIISYVVSGSLEHKDSMGNGSIIKAGDVQYMSAGTGVQHSEFNSSKTNIVRFLQIWIFPAKKNLTPRYKQISVDRESKLNSWCCVVSADGRENSIDISAPTKIYATILEENQTLSRRMESKKSWLQVISGKLEINNDILHAGDGASLDDLSDLTLKAQLESEFLLIEC